MFFLSEMYVRSYIHINKEIFALSNYIHIKTELVKIRMFKFKFIFYIINRFFYSVIKIRQLYESLPFDDPKGGVWTQGFDIQYDQSQWTLSNKLKIILMPHSHCDPGMYERRI